ncbi:MAG: AAA family ATPase [Deltaproteobacteria bacterium]|nr:AAA family ATPase [Deltaproteobacteria bacterium]
MQQEQYFIFRPFRLDVANARLWRRSQAITLRPKTFAVLCHLVARAGRLVTKKELLDAIWSDASVSDVVTVVCVQELREALGDQLDAPQFIETVSRRGYRFIASVTTATPPVPSPKSPVPSSRPKIRGLQSAVRNPQSAIGLVGRKAELAELDRYLEKAISGERQIVFVTGELGIGKTTVVEAFLQSLESRVPRLESKAPSAPPGDGQTRDARRQTRDAGMWIARGQCIEHYGASEAYLPVLEALGRVCRQPGSEQVVEVLGRYAPTWLRQMPWLTRAVDLEAGPRKMSRATREQMLREITEAVEMLTVEQPLVLFFEDLQWSDYSTVDVISFLARRQERARLLVIGTYRPVQVVARRHPLDIVKQELQAHWQCGEISLGFLTEADVTSYLAVRFAAASPETRHAGGEDLSRAPVHSLAQVVHQRTDGNPLFMVNLVDYLVAQGVVAQGPSGEPCQVVSPQGIPVGLPETLRQMIEKQIARLSVAEQRVLEVASVAGVAFSAATVAAGLGEDVAQSEERCAELARGSQFLRSWGVDEWPDGTVAGSYAFIHTLYQNVLYERLTAGQRLPLHRRIGERREAGYGDRAKEIAGELAVHFEQGRDYRRAVHYRQRAAKTALQRCAYQEAINHLNQGLESLKVMADTPERLQHEIGLRIGLGLALVATKGYAAAEVERSYSRALELCRQAEATPQLVWALWGLQGYYFVRGELPTARELGEQMVEVAERLQEPGLLGVAHAVLGPTLSALGEPQRAWRHLEQGLALCSLQTHARLHALCLSFGARVRLTLGYAEQAAVLSQEALRLAHELEHPLTSVITAFIGALLHSVRGEVQVAQELAEKAIALSAECAFVHWEAQAMALRGWALARQGQGEVGIAQIRQGLEVYQET